MRILIAGGGQSAALIASRLIREGNEVTIIDNSPERCAQLDEQLDAKIVFGSAASIGTLHKAGLKTAEMLIAVTNFDEVNMLACLIAKAESDVKVKVARIRNHEFERWEDVGVNKPVRLGITGESRAERARDMLPEGIIVRADRYEPFFLDNPDNLDGIIISAEAGSAWTILHPDYSLTIPEPQHSTPIGFMMRSRSSVSRSRSGASCRALVSAYARA